jgi:hypothetical protein
MKYELSNLDIGNYDVGGFQNSKIILGGPPPRGKEHGPETSQTRPG